MILVNKFRLDSYLVIFSQTFKFVGGVLQKLPLYTRQQVRPKFSNNHIVNE